MPTPLQTLRARLVEHANALPEQQALAWLDSHRLLTLHDEPRLRPLLGEYLRSQRRLATAKNLLAIRLFQEVVDTLGPLRVAPLKGTALIASLYADDIGLRPMGDIDLLVPGEESEEAVARLSALGFAETAVSHRIRHVSHHRVLVCRAGTVELHTRLGFTHGRGSRWQDLPLEPREVHDRKVHVLTPYGELVYLIAHCYKHKLFRVLLWVHEILALSERLPAEPVPEMARIAWRIRCRNVLAVTTQLLRHTLGPETLPQIDLAAVAPSVPRVFLERLLFVPSTVDPCQSFRDRNRWLEELHPHLLADTLEDSIGDFLRMLRIHFHARYPTRIEPHG